MTTAPAATLLGLQRPGVTVTGVLPDRSWSPRWDAIIVADDMKRRLLSFGLFCLTQRGGVSTVGLPVHGLALLSGPPGTGKTTLAHGLANRISRTLAERGLAEHALFAVVDPHAFPSEFLGESQRAVSRLFSDTLPELAEEGHPLIVLIDEVETLAMARSRASFETNPVDVHRATDAVLTGLDALADEHRNVLIVATTNDERAVDAAFLSRVDLHETFGLPSAAVIARILVDALAELGVDTTPDDAEVQALARACSATGVDARRVRKLVLRALVSNGVELALAPHQLRVQHLTALLTA
jgi:AAA+ superfamily predicted ATPase